MQNCWYPGKTPEELFDMVHPGMTRYSGSFRNEPVPDSSRTVTAGIWALVFVMILLLTVYDISYGKKEQSVRLIFGVDLNAMIRRKIFLDLLGLSAGALLAFLLVTPFTSPEFCGDVTFACFAVILAGNSLLIFWRMRRGKTVPLKHYLSPGILGMSMGFKGGTAVLTILACSVTLGLLTEGLGLWVQRGYYDSQEDRVHVKIAYPFQYEKIEYCTSWEEGSPPLETMDQIADDFLRYSYRYLDCALLYTESYEAIAPEYGERFVLANLQGLERFREEIPAWDILAEQEGVYILIPESADMETAVEEVLNWGGLRGLTEETLTGVYTYPDGLAIAAEGRQDGELDYTYMIRDPVIIVDAFDYGKLPVYPVSYSFRVREQEGGFLFYDAPYLMQFISVRDDPERIHAFAEACQGEAVRPALMEFTIENVGDWFQGLWELENRSLLIAVILTALLFIPEIQVTVLVLRIIYQTRARELTVKKISGYTILERYRSLFLLSTAVCGTAFAVSLIISRVAGIGLIRYLAVGSAVVWILDLLILVILTKKSDRLEIQRVLKGGTGY